MTGVLFVLCEFEIVGDVSFGNDEGMVFGDGVLIRDDESEGVLVCYTPGQVGAEDAGFVRR